MKKWRKWKSSVVLSLILCVLMMQSAFAWAAELTIENVSADGTGLSVAAHTDDLDNASYYISAYDRYGKMLGISAANAGADGRLNVVIPKASAAERVKAFAVNAGSSEPLTSAATGKVGQITMGSSPSDYSITALKIDVIQKKLTATVSTLDDCTLSVSFMSEDGKNSLFEIQEPVSGSLDMAEVTSEYTGSLPQYFLAVATLVDDNGKALCSDYTCRSYTKAHQSAALKTPDSLRSEGSTVVEFGADGFGALSDKARVESSTVTTSEVGGITTYTFSPSQTISVGDCLVLTGTDRGAIPVKAGSVVNNGNGTVTITANSSTVLSDFYSFLKINTTEKLGTTHTPATEPEGVSAGLPGLSAELLEEGNVEWVGFEANAEWGALKVSANVSVGVTIKLLYDEKLFGDDYFENEMTVDVSGSVKAETLAGVKNDSQNPPSLPIYDGEIPIGTTGLSAKVEVSIPFEYEIGAIGTASIGFTSKNGFTYNPNDGYQTVKSNQWEPVLKIKGAFKLKAGPQVSAGIQFPNGIMKAAVVGAVGAQITGETYVHTGDDVTRAFHACNLCIDGDASLFSDFHGELTYRITDTLKGTLAQLKLFSGQAKLLDYYFSADNASDSNFLGLPAFGKGSCPNWKSPVVIHTYNNNGEELNGVDVSLYNSGDQLISSWKSPYTVCLYNGRIYTAKADITGFNASNSFEVKEDTGNVFLRAANGMLKRIVTDKESGAVIEGARVTAFKNNEQKGSGTTDEDGGYSIDLTDGTYEIQISAEGYETLTINDITTRSGKTTQLNQGMELVGGFISGSVTDYQSGSAIEAATVNIYQDNELINTFVTDENGGYTTTKLPEATYQVKFSASGYAGQDATAVVTAKNTSTVNAQLIKGGGKLTGAVKDSAKIPQPVSNAEVSVYQGDSLVRSTLTGSDGSYELVLLPGEYTVKVKKENYAEASGAAVISEAKETLHNVTLYPGGTCGDNLYWKIEDSKLTIYGSGDMYDYGLSNAPWKKNPYTSIVIEDGATSIGSSAFYFSAALATVDIPASVKTINPNAFQACWISQLNIEPGVTRIGRYAFYQCRILSTFEIPDSVEYIEEYAFWGALGLPASLIIPDGVKSIGGSAFACVDALERVFIPESVTKLGDRSFYTKAYYDYSKLTDIYYGGDEAAWNQVVSAYKTYYSDFILHYHSTGLPIVDSSAKAV